MIYALPGFHELEVDALENKGIDAVWAYFTDKKLQHYIVPDVHADLVFMFDVKASGQLCNIEPVLSPPFCHAHKLTMGANRGAVGIRFKPGMTNAFLQRPLHEVFGRLQYGKDILNCPPWVESICSNKTNLSALISEINRQVYELFPQENTYMRRDFITLMHSTSGTIRIQEMASLMGVTTRTVNRYAVANLGMPAKQYGTILRLQNVVGKLSATDDSLASIAVDCGFADQAHLSRELKKGTGFTPKQLQAMANDNILL